MDNKNHSIYDSYDFENHCYEGLERNTMERAKKTGTEEPDNPPYVRKSTMYKIIGVLVLAFAIIFAGSLNLVYSMAENKCQCQPIPTDRDNVRGQQIQPSSEVTDGSQTTTKTLKEGTVKPTSSTTKKTPVTNTKLVTTTTTTGSTTTPRTTTTTTLPTTTTETTTSTTTLPTTTTTITETATSTTTLLTTTTTTTTTTETTTSTTTLPTTASTTTIVTSPTTTTWPWLTTKNVRQKRQTNDELPNSHTTNALGCPICPSTWPFQHGSSCYRFVLQVVTWTSAKSACRSYGGYLVEILHAEEQNFLASIASRMYLKSMRFWIGLTDLTREGTFVWDHSYETLTSDSYSNWARYQPDNGSGTEDCTHLFENTFYWNDDQCYNRHYFICEKDGRD